MNRISYGSVSLVKQGNHTFYSLTIPSRVLAETCFVINRDEDPIAGFQRELDRDRAQEIADYIDNGLGTIPSSIVLSAQENAVIEYNSKSKSISFLHNPKAFLIIDGQHRVYGFSLAKSDLRIPVIIYNKLSRRDESRLFIDINSKQKGVPPELLLDIKKLAEYETDQEQQLRTIFDLFMSENNSILLGKLSPSTKSDKKLTRVIFNQALKSVIRVIGNRSEDEMYMIYNNYLLAINKSMLINIGGEELITQPTFFKALSAFFFPVATRVKSKYGSVYTLNNFYSIVYPSLSKIKKSKIKSLGSANLKIAEYLEESLDSGFTL